MKRLRLALWLGLRDLVHDRHGFITQTVALAALLAPLLLLYSLRVGVIGTLLADLTADPRNRQIVLMQQGHYPEEFFARLRTDPRVAFVAGHASPIARNLSFTKVTAEATAPLADGVVLASGHNDPLLADGMSPPRPGEAVLTRLLAARLKVSPGDRVAVWAHRRLDRREEDIDLQLIVTGIVDPTVWDAAGALLAESTLAAIEQWRDGLAVTAYGWPGRLSDAPFAYRNFRLYAVDLPALEALHAELQTQGVPVSAPNLKNYQAVMALNGGLGVIFLVIAGASGLGFLLSFGATLWGNVRRKRQAISVLRLHGLLRRHAVLFPVVQAVAVALSGAALAVGIHVFAGTTINRALSGSLLVSGPVSRIEVAHVITACVLTLAIALLASLSAAVQVLHIEPGEGIRES